MKEMKVSLVSYTPNAWELLLGTKSVRMRGQNPADMTEEEKKDHWAYMLDTIKSPFDFVDFIFNLENVSKNMTHQLVRTRDGAYQQESSRALELDVYGSTVVPEKFKETGPGGEPSELFTIWCEAMSDAQTHYQRLIEAGAELQDARAVAPSNMGSNILVKFSLRTMNRVAMTRLCPRTQGEYQAAFREMRRLVLEVYPMFESLLQVNCVATGQCAFPRWGKEKCNFYRPWMDKTEEQKELAKVFWSSPIQQANPVASNGKSM